MRNKWIYNEKSAVTRVIYWILAMCYLLVFARIVIWLLACAIRKGLW